MAALWAAHDRVARDLLVVHGGREIDKTDGFLLLFDDPVRAVDYAVAYHRAIGALEPPLQARAGLHVGDVILTRNAAADVARGAKPLEVDGMAKPKAARVMSVAAGGQTLVTREALAGLSGTAWRVQSHGHWRMKGVSDPIELFEIGDDGAPFTPPPDGAKVYRVVEHGGLWVPVRELKHSLPAERDAFVGRGADLQRLARMVEDARLVSVLGIGGTGKTRLVTRFGWTWLGDFPGGVWFCDLSEARSVGSIAAAVARALDVPLGKDDPVVQIGHALAARGPALVILDNFEQVTRHADETLGRWLDRAADARFVVTTREVLGLPGETALPLAPLASDDSVDLFVTRARQARPDFTVDDADTVRQLVTLLDRLPLAIELAAARVRVMPPRTLLQRMSQRFQLLAASGGRHTRQATLRGALDWSWELLTSDEQAALAQVSVFEGGFSLQAAEAVLVLDALWPIDAVQSLVDKSLVRQVGDDRFDLLVSVQEYAAEKLGDAERGPAEARHAGFFAVPEPSRADLDNLVTACRRSVERGDTSAAVALLRGTWHILGRTGPFPRAVQLAEAVSAMDGLPPHGRAAVRHIHAWALHFAGAGPDAVAVHEEALALHRALGDRRAEGDELYGLGTLLGRLGRVDEALPLLASGLAIAREVGDRRTEAKALNVLGTWHQHRGQLREARDHLEAALALYRELGIEEDQATPLTNLGLLHRDQGRLDEARESYRAALEVARKAGVRSTTALSGMAIVCAMEGALDEAETWFDASLAASRELGDRRGEAIDLGNLGMLCVERRQLDRAAAFIAAAVTLHHEVGNREAEGISLGNLGALALEQGRLQQAEHHLQRALAIAREIRSPRSEAIVLDDLGALHAQLGRTDEAVACLDASERLFRGLDNQHGLATVLCTRARVEVTRGDRDAAHAALDEARAIARSLGVDPIALLGRSLTAAAEALGEAP